ncbi:hypothetical protein [Leptolyngbya sp. SLC-A1]
MPSFWRLRWAISAFLGQDASAIARVGKVEAVLLWYRSEPGR